MKRLSTLLLAAWLATASAGGWLVGAAQAAERQPIRVVAAENFYGEVIRQLGGERVAVLSIMSNPDQDPHLFEASPATARALANARLVVFNGANYDPWIGRLLQASRGVGRTELDAGTLTGKRAGDNPHLWYDPATMPAVARAVTAYLTQADPEYAADYRRRLDAFLASLEPLQARIAALRARHAGTAVTATEPVFTYMTDAIGLHMLGERLQLSVMNETEPSAADIAAFERNLRQHRAKALIFNVQTSSQLTRRLRATAVKAGVPIVAVTETEPAGLTYQAWMAQELDALARALDGKAP